MARALVFGLGAAFVEFMQVLVALKFTTLFMENPMVEKCFQAISTVVFLAAGIYFLLYTKAKTPTAKSEIPHRKRGEFLRGMLVSSLNLMVIPYWVFYGMALTANGLLRQEDLYLFIFSVGTMAGTFSLLCLYALLGVKILSKSEQMTKWVNRFIGLILVGFGLYQMCKLIGWF